MKPSQLRVGCDSIRYDVEDMETAAGANFGERHTRAHTNPYITVRVIADYRQIRRERKMLGALKAFAYMSCGALAACLVLHILGIR